MPKTTPLHSDHLDLGAKMADFAGWEMPIHYGSQIEEHLAVRQLAGMFDVSHMGIVDLVGPDATAFLRHLLANDVEKLDTPGKALYSAMLNPQGGVIDDLIVYAGNGDYRLVINAGRREVDIAWMNEQIAATRSKVELAERTDLAMLAIQGPKAVELCSKILHEEWEAEVLALKPFHGQAFADWFIARTGYTGEDGLEIMLPSDEAALFWLALLNVGVRPAGLGARDTLRLEAGMNLYGHEMDEQISPLESGMGWTIAWQPQARDFIGRAALEAQQQAGVPHKQCGLILAGRGIMRAGQRVQTPVGEGVITSGTFSPTLQCSIAMARVPQAATGQVAVLIRDVPQPARIVSMPFVRKGKTVYKE